MQLLMIMLGYLRNLRKSEAEKRQEALNAYLDDEMSARERQRFEDELAQDPRLRAELAQLRQLKNAVQGLPRLRAPRNFTLDPAVYGAPESQRAYQWYPMLRAATAVAAFLFIFVVALDLFTPAGALEPVLRGMAPQAVEEVQVGGEDELSSVTRMVTGEAGAPQEETVEMDEEAADMEAESALAVEEAAPVEEEVAEEPAAAEAAEDTVEEVPEALEEGEVTAGGGGLPPTGSPSAALAAPAPTEQETTTAEATTAPLAEARAPEATAAVEVEPAAQEPLSTLVLVEIILGVLLLALLVATLVLRRNL